MSLPSFKWLIPSQVIDLRKIEYLVSIWPWPFDLKYIFWHCASSHQVSWIKTYSVFSNWLDKDNITYNLIISCIYLHNSKLTLSPMLSHTNIYFIRNGNHYHAFNFDWSKKLILQNGILTCRIMSRLAVYGIK